MDEQFKNKIINDLKKSGFGSEMQALRAFLTNEWHCSGGAAYYDRDEQRTREIDFLANRYLSKDSISCGFYLVGEVKKTERPWVVFKGKQPGDLPRGWRNLVFFDNLPPGHGPLMIGFDKHSLSSQCLWYGYGIHESFKNPNQTSRWYSAFLSSCKAAEYILESLESLVNEKEDTSSDWSPNKESSLCFLQPIVVVDGPLLAADLNDCGEIVIEEIDAAPISFEYRTRQYKQRWGYAVDVVRLSAITNYIGLTERRHQDIFDWMIKIIN